MTQEGITYKELAKYRDELIQIQIILTTLEQNLDKLLQYIEFLEKEKNEKLSKLSNTT